MSFTEAKNLVNSTETLSWTWPADGNNGCREFPLQYTT